jgi:hypothetical protein
MSPVQLDSRETGVCVDCGRSHDAASRLRLIRPMVGMDPVDIAREWSCFYGPVGGPGWKQSAGYRLLFRDLKAIRTPGRPTPQRSRRSA